MNQKWNLQDIRPAKVQTKKITPNKTKEVDEKHLKPETERPHNIPIENGRKKKKNNIMFFIVTLLIFVGGIIAISTVMRGAEVHVYPITQQPNLNTVITSYKKLTQNDLQHEIMTIKAVAEDQLEAQGEITEETKAFGRITVFNENNFTQRLVANTRFESPDGKIYRISEEVTIPPSVGSGANVNPGSITVDITADNVGEDYNIDDTVMFRIPGFAEGGFDALYQTVYAENQSSIEGGFSGKRFKVDDDDRKLARQKLQMSLRTNLLDQLDSSVPAGMIYYEDSIIFVFKELPPVEYRDGMVTLKEQATLMLPLFDGGNLAQYIAKATIPGYQGEDVRIINEDTLNFSYSNIEENTNISELESFNFNLTGRPKIVWNFNENDLKTKLAGTTRDSVKLIINEFPGIEKAEVKVRPFWQNSFPNDIDLIEIIEITQ